MALTDEDRVLYTGYLKEAQKAYRDLMTGQAVAAFTDQNGERVSFTKVDLDSLRKYIADLIALLGLGPVVTPANSTHPRPMRFLFGGR